MRRVFCACAFVLLTAAGVSAQPMVGFQAGGTIDPEQAFAGVHWQSADLGRFAIRTGLDGGFGGDLRVGTVNLDIVVEFPLGGSGWNLVQGGGPTIAFTRFAEETDVSAGISYLFGFAREEGFFTELRFGSGRVPSMKYSAGWRIQF